MGTDKAFAASTQTEEEARSSANGRPQTDDGLLYVLRTGVPMESPATHAGGTQHRSRPLSRMAGGGSLCALWQAALVEYDQLKGLRWQWQALDGAMTKAPLGGKRDGPQSHGSRQIRDPT